ncbi:MAG TPA: IPT/TIG domain-containing protein, partial [Pyrinomonadaceae bacterium]|nr:IPT/TIG domain-containing protein [Pyrinomonadaceae bacterium]
TFTYDPPPPPPGSPRIDEINPAEGPTTRSISVVISGANFARNSNVRFGGVDAKSVTFDNPEQLTVQTPKDVMAGSVRVKVVNPDQTTAVRDDGFKFNDPPIVRSIDPPEGPREGAISVNVLGANFRSGASVRFGGNQALVVNADGSALTCVLPPGPKGPVDVRVDNPAPDSQSGTLSNAFTYLGEKQQKAARIFSVSPKTVLLETKTRMTVKGRNLKTAVQEGTFAVRGFDKNFASVNMTELTIDSSPATQEDVVTFFLTISRPAGLTIFDRVPYFVVASVRRKSRKNRVFETSRKGQFILVTNASPLAFGVTAELIEGTANLILLSGRNLKGSTVALKNASGVSLPISFVDDRENLLLIGATLPDGMAKQTSGPQPTLTLIGPNKQTIGNPISLNVMPGAASDADNDVPAGSLKPVPGQRVMTPQPGAVGLYAFASSGDGGEWLPGGPIFDLPDVSYIPVLANTFEFAIELVNESFVAPAFGRTSKARLGTIKQIRGVPLIVHIEVTLYVLIQVFVFEQGEPFPFDPVGDFNEFTDVFPNAFGTYVGPVTVSSRELTVGFVVGLVSPTDIITILQSVNVDATLSTDQKQLTVGGQVVLKAHIKSIRPLNGAPNLLLAGPAVDAPPLSDAATFLGYFFASRVGGGCVDWKFNVQFTKAFLDGTPVDPNDDGEDVFVVRICTEVVDNRDLHILTITSEPTAIGLPPTLGLDTNTRRDAVLHTMLVRLDARGNPIGKGTELFPPQVVYRFDPQPANSQAALTINTDIPTLTTVRGEAGGRGQIQVALVAGPDTALLPSSVFGFLPAAQNGAAALGAQLAAQVIAQNQVTVDLISPPQLRPESFMPLTSIPSFLLMVKDPLPAGVKPDDDITFTITREEILAFPDPMDQALGVDGGTVRTKRVDKVTMPTTAEIEARFARFFQGTLVANKTFTTTLKASAIRDANSKREPLPLTNLTIAPNQVE